MTQRADTSRDQRRADEQATPSAGLVPNVVPVQHLRPSLQPIKVSHLREYARYRRKVGDLHHAEIVLHAVDGLPDDARVTGRELVEGKPRSEAEAIAKAIVFVFDLYRDLGVLI